jgi:hypothetical protein
MSLWSTLPPDEQLLIEPADEADLALAGEQDERADLAAYRRARRRARTRRLPRIQTWTSAPSPGITCASTPSADL